MERVDLWFDSGDSRCAAWFYPAERKPAPCLVMAPGFSALREDSLPQFAEAFARAGFSVLLFDYRHFGDSEGSPRQLVDIGRQLADYRAAVGFARSLPEVDPARIVLFGTSFSGGHVLTVAAEDPSIAGVIAQCPFLDGLATLLRARPLTNIPRGTVLGLLDLLKGGVMIPVAGPPGSFAAMNAPEALPGFQAMLGPNSRWRNEVAARIVLTLPTYRPLRKAKRVRCPVLLCVCLKDQTTPPEFALQAARQMPRATVRRYDLGHFDVYQGEGFEQVLRDQLEFLAQL